MALSHVGINSMQAVNQWVGVISSNLEGASRTAYKTTRPSFTDGLGISKTGTDLKLPPATLTLNATTIEWGQGAITNTDNATDFAIQGEGFFVVVDQYGRYFATRDGEFHWDHQGYLVNSAGLKVLSNGQDFIRYHRTDRNDSFDFNGESKELDHFGDKSLLVVDFANLDGLKMSKYGSTVFEIPGELPLRVQNDLNSTTDGISFIYDDPLSLSPVSLLDTAFTPPPPAFTFPPLDPLWLSSDFSIDFGDNGVFRWSETALANAQGLAAGANAVLGDNNYGFNAASVSISQFVTEINNWATAPPRDIQLSYDANSDKLSIINDVTLTGTENRVVFDGPNGLAVRRFFNIRRNQPSSPNLSQTVSSQSDIDNSILRNSLDILGIATAGLPDVNDSMASLLSPSAPIYAHLKVGDPALNGAQVGGTILSDTRTTTVLERFSHLAIGESHATGEFDLEFGFRLSNQANGQLVFNFGQEEPHKMYSNGYNLLYDPGAGTLSLQKSPVDANGTPTNIQTVAFPNITTALGAGNPPPPTGGGHVFQARLNEQGQLYVAIDGTNTTFNLIPDRDLNFGHLSLGNSRNVLELTSLSADFKGRFNQVGVGGIVSVSPTEYSNVDIKNAWQDRTRSRIIQNAKETSLASLTEYVPLLAVAQKVFSAVSKLITTHNALLDDMNSLIR